RPLPSLSRRGSLICSPLCGGSHAFVQNGPFYGFCGDPVQRQQNLTRSPCARSTISFTTLTIRRTLMTDSILELYVNDGLSDEEIDQQRATYGPLTGDVRELIQLALQTRVDADDVARAREHLAAAREILERDREDGPYGTRFNDSGRFRNWGNAAIGLRNAIAPIGDIHEDDDGRVWTDIHLGPVYEGPAGHVHG